MTKFKNYYHILELGEFADGEAIKAAYRKLARQYHPDVNPSDAAGEKFKLLNEAYDVLGDPDKKVLYDQSLKIVQKKVTKPAEAKTTAGASGKKASPPPSSSDLRDKTAASINELFESFLKKGLGGVPPQDNKTKHSHKKEQDGVFKNNRKDNKATRGQDVTVEASITPMEAQQGVVKTVNVQHNEVCKRCNGTGKINGSQCGTCHGEKIMIRLKKIDVRIPAGVKQGSKVRVAGEGGRGQNNGENGDLFLQIQIAMDPSLRIEGLDVYGEAVISVLEAVLGGEINVPTLAGSYKVTIPPLSSTGKVLRLKEQGVQNGQLKGDHFVTLKIMAPESLTAKEKELYEELARLQKNAARKKS